MGFEKCDECGFSGEKWSDAGAISAIAHLPARFADAVADLSPNELLRRPVEDQWSIAEYTDHVRELRGLMEGNRIRRQEPAVTPN
jgi:hypothetical protein